MTRLRLLDEVSWSGTPLSGRGVTLLALLVAAGGRAVAEGDLIEAIWDDEPAHPAKALQVVVSRVRSQTDAAVVERVEGGYRLGIADVELGSVRRPPGDVLVEER